ncbi:MAG: MerR family transcriptional regulator [Ignavibacteria bacterium]
MTIGQLANRTKLTVQTIRYYESIKILPKPKVKESGYRLYSADYIDKIDFIKKAKELGFTLREIKSILKIDECDDMYELAMNKLDETKKKINYYKQLTSKMERLIQQCPNSGSINNCSIIKSLNIKN